jgi:hypothetical protein
MGCRPDPQPTTMTADELARLGADISPHSVLLRHHPRGEPTVEGPGWGRMLSVGWLRTTSTAIEDVLRPAGAGYRAAPWEVSGSTVETPGCSSTTRMPITHDAAALLAVL